ncbi:MAG: hypothetical protein ABIJ41_05395 [Candidatus Omnitrophota bacterium]
MNDTPKKMISRYHALLMKKSGEERLLMGCSMFDAAREIVRSSILNQKPWATPQDIKKEIFLRFYGLDYSKEKREEILEVINLVK